MAKIEFRLERDDSHWVKLNNPDGTARELDDWWENASLRGQHSATIDIKIPELQGEAKITMRWSLPIGIRAWYSLGLDKSKDGARFVEHWHKTGMSPAFDRTYEIDLDPAYQYYRVIFSDGNLGWEKMRVHKDVIAEGPGIVPVPVAPLLFYQVLAGSTLAGIAMGVITASIS